MSLYTSVEKTFFSSLTRKIAGNVLFLLLPYLVLLLAGFYYAGEAGSMLDALALPEDRSEALRGLFAEAAWVGGAVILFALLSGLFSIGFMRHLFLRPVREMTAVLRGIRDKDGDISATLPDYTFDEISEMAGSYNDFAASLRRMIAETRRRSVRVALCSTRLKQALERAHRSVSEQESQAQLVFQSSQEATQALDEIAGTTLKINEQNSENLRDVRDSSSELQRVREQVGAIHSRVTDFQETVQRLSENSGNITNILSMVKDFSDQTNLLALNASIEAARAGEAGRGFAVVADEVRNLSRKVSQATVEIDGNVGEMAALVASTRQSARDILSYVEDTDSFIDSTSGQFLRMVQDFEQVSSQLSGISAAIDELAHTNKNSHGHVSRISEIATAIEQEMNDSQDTSEQLEISTEESQELLSRFIIGYGGFENMIQTGRRWAGETTQALAALQQQGLDIFDSQYRRTNPGQEPAKFDVGYVDAYEKLLRPLFDGFLRERPEFTYAIGVDRNGYAPAHHSKVSRALTGDAVADNLHSRHRRIFFGTRAEQRRATHSAPFLLQTFIRDTGEVLNDLSIPIHIDGRHWGALIMGFEPRHLLDEEG
ncbi:methyl-accepting chemotaxis protein [Marinobacterium aestuariivivens]|uniref:Methyl-accepting chemotaxis protein n=1 Tax=Marinobacterium aestuariivivens TaxID=1698799 RepID=A0ABW2A8W7_9GAMM